MHNVARKYAQAFMTYKDFYAQDISFCVKLETLITFFERYRERLLMRTKELYKTLFGIFEFEKEDFAALLELLERDNRLFLLKDVLKNMSFLYQKRNAVDVCTITSAHPLTSEQLACLQQFLEQNLHKRLVYRYAVDKSLIAGIRVQGTTFLWENSIDQRLRLIEQAYG